MSTIKDVAKQTGLSIATISKYLNGGNVRLENRALIEQAIERLDYRVNRHAQSLKTNRTRIVGVIMPTLSIPFFGSMYSALDRVLREEGYTTFAVSYDFNRELELEKLRTFISNDVDGIVLVPEAVTANEIKSILQTAGRDLPVIMLDRTITDYSGDYVVIDNLNATYGAVEVLVVQNHKRIGIISGPLHISTAYERLIGFRRVQRDYGIALDDSLIHVDEYGNDANSLVRIGNYDFESGYRLFNELMDIENPPTAICVTNYDMAVGAITAARERSITLGRDLGFVGFDAVTISQMIVPPLPVVEQPTFEMGETAGRLLLRRLAGDKEGFPTMVRLKSKLHVPKTNGDS